MTRNPARHVQEVYSVALGVALVLSVEQVVDLEREGAPFHTAMIPAFLAFVTLAFTLYHWSARYLDFKYLESSDASRRRPGLFAELLVGAVEILVLITLSVLISRPTAFAVGMVTLLGLEVAAGFVLRAAGSYGGLGRLPASYLWINAVSFVALAAAVIGIEAIDVTGTGQEIALGSAAAAVAVVRGAFVYRAGFEMLFPDLAK
ncbi:MAG: hypothetical protein M3238_02340 [Actinomycetota bacterium]|nr:hypothetical protein [Actinomycetota bacterium]